ncbi:MAG: glycosyltransferase family 4 protein [Bacteroidetes bacterium]|nr:glycosyltransferase family 4 protein [Bacteroidota bacterium]MBS1650113.1 glycosyltransferase family 4 protein [Bacteroidota bacterium]
MIVMGIISYKVFPANMGGQKGVAMFYEYLSKQTETILVTTKENKTANFSVINQYNFLFNHNWGWLNIFYINKLIYLIRQHKVDVVIIEHSYLGFLGILLKLFTRKPLVIHSHNIEAYRFKQANKFWWKFYEHYEKWIHAKSNHVFYKTLEDATYATTKWQLKNHAYSVIPFGTDLKTIPFNADKETCRNFICNEHNINPNDVIFLFNGTLDFEPNIHSIQIIINEITPLLIQSNFQYKIIICGNRLQENLLQQIKTCKNLIYAGFVNNINTYIKAANAFIVPSFLATGIKTKIIEALANNTLVIADVENIKGIDVSALNNKLISVETNNSKAFSEIMLKTKLLKNENTPQQFYTTYYWGNIINKAILSLQNL